MSYKQFQYVANKNVLFMADYNDGHEVIVRENHICTVTEILGNGTYRIEAGNASCVVDESELELTAVAKDT
jgi:hypothetical protein